MIFLSDISLAACMLLRMNVSSKAVSQQIWLRNWATDCTMLQRVIKALVSNAESSVTHTYPGWLMLYNGYAVQELHGSDADLNEVRGSRPEADDSTQLTAPLCQTHPPAAPQVCLFVLFALVNHMVPHGVFWHAQWLMCKSHSKHCRSSVASSLVTTNDSIHDIGAQHGIESEFK